MNNQKSAYNEIMGYTDKLEKASLELRSKLTPLLLYTEDSEELSAEEKDCILNILDTIKKKSDELVNVEEQLKEVISLLASGKAVNELEASTI